MNTEGARCSCQRQPLSEALEWLLLSLFVLLPIAAWLGLDDPRAMVGVGGLGLLALGFYARRLVRRQILRTQGVEGSAREGFEANVNTSRRAPSPLRFAG